MHQYFSRPEFSNIEEFQKKLRKIDAYLAKHKIEGDFFPAVNFILMIWKIFAKLCDTKFERLLIIFENVWFQHISFLPKKETKFLITFLKGQLRYSTTFATWEMTYFKRKSKG